MKYRLINDSTITNLRQSLLCLDLDRITGSDSCAIAMESVAQAVDKLCCPIKYKTLSNKDLKKPWITSELISNIKKTLYFALYCQNKNPKDLYTHFQILSQGKLHKQKRIIMNINSILQKTT